MMLLPNLNIMVAMVITTSYVVLSMDVLPHLLAVIWITHRRLCSLSHKKGAVFCLRQAVLFTVTGYVSSCLSEASSVVLYHRVCDQLFVTGKQFCSLPQGMGTVVCQRQAVLFSTTGYVTSCLSEDEGPVCCL